MFQEGVVGREGHERVLEVLTRVREMIAVQVLFGGRDIESTLTRLDPLWEWLFAHRRGLLQADGEGFYDATGLVLGDD